MTNASICEAKNNSTPMKSTLLGKRAPSDNVSSNSQLATRSIIHSKSYRRVKPRLSQPDNSRNERSRSLSSSVVSSDSVLSSTTFASEVLAASTSCSVDRHTGNKDEITVGSSDIETSSPSNSSSSSSSSSDSSSSRENTISDNGNNSGSLGCENVALSDFGKSCSDDKSDEIMNSSASDNTSANGGQNPRNGDELRNRLAAFLPQLAAANDALHNDVRDGYGEKYHIEKVDESKEQYVEMELGMGVLEERPDRGNNIDIACDKSDSESNNSEDTQGYEDVIGTLLGQNRNKQSCGGIQVIF